MLARGNQGAAAWFIPSLSLENLLRCGAMGLNPLNVRFHPRDLRLQRLYARVKLFDR